MKKQVAVIFGGKSSEHEVSCRSVLNVIKGFSPEKYEIHLIGITKEGHWIYVPDATAIEDGSWYNGKKTAIISPDAINSGIYVCDDEGHYERQKIDVIFPVLHGKFGEDGTIQGVFEMSGIPYVGCGVLSSSVSMDKISTKIFVEKLGIRQAKFVADIAPDLSELDHTVAEVEEKLGYPVFVKPSNAGSSCGVSKAENREELKAAVELAKKHDTRVLIEEMICGHEVECAVLGGRDPKASKVGEVVAAAEFYDYDAKYNNSESKTVIDPDTVPQASKDKVREDAVAIFKAVSGFSLSRVDFFIENETNDVVFNEINTLPGFTNISMYPMLWADMGLSITELIDRIVETAYER